MAEIVFLIFVSIAGLTFLIYLVLSILFSVYKPQHIDEGYLPPVSIVIAARNACDKLKILIPKLLDQKYPELEVVLVNDRSTDETYETYIVEAKENLRLKFINIEETPAHINEKKFAITLGIRAAKSDIILLTDADCEPIHENWVSRMIQPFKDEKVMFSLGYSQYNVKKGFLNGFIRFETMLTAFTYFGLALVGLPYMGVGRNLAYRKSFFLSKNGFGRFQSILGGDDDLFVNQYASRKNTKVVMHFEATTFSEPKTSLGDFIIQKTRHLSVGKHYKNTDKLILGLILLLKYAFFGTFVAALALQFKPIEVVICFIIAMLTYLISLYILKQKTGDPSKPWLIPVFDVLYLFYYIFILLKVKLTRKVKWS
ncbi:MAG: glycosyltransferase [Cyclobacteriaceae bacterium]